MVNRVMCWDGNEGNILIGKDQRVVPIDSQFTLSTNEPEYAENIAKLLKDSDSKEKLIDAAFVILGINPRIQTEIKNWFSEGIDAGINILINSDFSSIWEE